MNKYLKKIFAVVLACAMTVSMVACGGKTEEASEALFNEGTYTAVGQGMGGDVTVEVAVTSDKITAVTVKEHKETPGVSDSAIEQIPAKIVEIQGLGIDAIAGATITSNAIIAAVTDCMTQAGADIEALQAIKDEAVGEAENVTLEADVVVVGAGGAGLSAAIEAGKAGSSVIVVEKMPKVGGNTLICGSGYNAVDPRRQSAMGIEDSEELFFNQTMEGGDNEANPALVKIMVEGAYEGIEFLESYGMEWQEEMSTAPGGLYQRRHMPANGALGVPMINALTKGCEENNVEIITDTKANELVLADGKVTGVIATGKTGNVVTINANKGVVIATGGFSANVEMRQEYNTIWPTLDENIPTTNQPGATGDGIEIALKAGAALEDMQFIQLFPYGEPVTGAMTGSIMKQPENAVYINKEGVRFVNEYDRRDVVSAAILDQTDAQMFVIVDGKTYVDDNAPTDFGTTIGEEVESGRSVKGNTIEELATAMNMDPVVVKKTIDDYNAGVDANNDIFGKTPMNKIDTAPFYGSPRTPTVHHTMGGIKINEKAQVINTSGEIIPNLYAAGEVTGDIHGTNRVGANALPDIIVFGRIAGETVAAAK